MNHLVLDRCVVEYLDTKQSFEREGPSGSLRIRANERMLDGAVLFDGEPIRCKGCSHHILPITEEGYRGVGLCPNKSCPLTKRRTDSGNAHADRRCAHCGAAEFSPFAIAKFFCPQTPTFKIDMPAGPPKDANPWRKKSDRTDGDTITTGVSA